MPTKQEEEIIKELKAGIKKSLVAGNDARKLIDSLHSYVVAISIEFDLRQKELKTKEA